MRVSAGTWSVLLGVLGLAGLAGAQERQPSENEMATRRLLIADAQRAAGLGQHARALELANQAGGILLTPSLRYFMATEQQAEGHLAAAYGNADRCEREIEREPNVALRRELTARCHTLSAALLPRLARITVRLADAPEGAAVTVNGSPLARSLWNLPYAVDPGTVRVEASAQGRTPFRGELPVAEGASGELAVTLAPAAVAEPVAPPAPVVREQPVRGPGPAPIAIAVVGGAIAAGGAVLLVLGAVNGGQARSVCPDYVCDTQAQLDQARPSFDAMRNFNIAGAVMLPVGVVALAAGLGWYFTAPRPRATNTATVHFSPTPSGFVMLGSF